MRALSVVFFGLLCASLCLASCPCTSTNLSCGDGRTATTGTLALYTWDGVSGKPFSARVMCEYRYDRREATSDSTTGLTFLTGLKPGRLTCSALKPGYAFTTVDVTIQARVHSNVNMTLAPIVGTVRGRVVDSAGERGLSGATVSCVGNDKSTVSPVTTDSSGNFALSNIRSRFITCTASLNGYDSPNTTIYIAGLVSSGRIVLSARSGSLNGTVVDGASAPLSRAVVVCNGPSEGRAVITGGDGSFRFSNLNGGAYSCVVYKYKFADQAVSVNVSSGSAASVKVTLAPAPSVIYGTVSDVFSGAPLGQATVACGTSTTTTRPDGGYSLTVNTANVNCTVTLAGYGTLSKTVEVSAGITVFSGFQLTASTRTLRGKIVSADSLHLPAASLSCYEMESGKLLETSVEDDGSFSLQRRKRGEFKCVASAEGFEAAHKIAEFDEDLGELKISIAPAVSKIFVTVVDAETGSVIPSASVTCAITTDSGRKINVNRIADAAGQAVLYNLRVTGVVSCSSIGSGYRESLVHFAKITPGSMIDIKIAMDPAPAVVEGLVVTEATKPISGANIKCFQKGQPVFTTNTNEEGSFKFEDVNKGEWTCFLSATGFTRSTVIIQVKGGMINTVHFALGETLGEINVELVDIESLSPVPFTPVSVSSTVNKAIVFNDIVTDENGRATFKLPADNYLVKVNVSSHYIGTKTASLTPGAKVMSSLTLRRISNDLHGRIVDSVTGENIPNAIVTLSTLEAQKPVTVYADSFGYFHLSKIHPGTYVLSASAEFYSHNSVLRTFEKTGRCVDCLHGMLSLSLTRNRAEIEGSVKIDGYRSSLVGLIHAEVRSKNDETLFSRPVDEQGNFHIPISHEGTYYVSILSGLWSAEPQEVRVEKMGQKYTVDFELSSKAPRRMEEDEEDRSW